MWNLKLDESKKCRLGDLSGTALNEKRFLGREEATHGARQANFGVGEDRNHQKGHVIIRSGPAGSGRTRTWLNRKRIRGLNIDISVEVGTKYLQE